MNAKKLKIWGSSLITTSSLFFCAWVLIFYFPEYQVWKTTRNIENEIVNGDTYLVDIKSLDSLTYHSIPPLYIYADGRLRKYKNVNKSQTNIESPLDTFSIYDQRGKFDIVVDSTIIKPYTKAFEIDYLIRKSEFCIEGKNSYEIASITTDPLLGEYNLGQHNDYLFEDAKYSWENINRLRENVSSVEEMQSFFSDTLWGLTKTLFFYTQGDDKYFYTESFRNDKGEVVKTCGVGCINIIDKRPFLYINNDTISNKEQCQQDNYSCHSICEYQIKPYRIFYKNDSNINPIADIKESFRDLTQNISSGKINGQEGISVQMNSNITSTRFFDSFKNNNFVYISHWIKTYSPIICDGCITSPFKHNYNKGNTHFYQNKYACNSNYGNVDEDLICDFLLKYGKPYLYFFEYEGSWLPKFPELKDIYSHDGIPSLADSLLLLPTNQSYKFYQNTPNVDEKHNYTYRLTPKPLKYEEWDQYITDVRRAKANDRLFNYPMYYYTTISKHNYDVIYVLTNPKYYSYEVHTDCYLSDKIRNICIPILIVGIIFLIVGFLLFIIYKRILHAK